MASQRMYINVPGRRRYGCDDGDGGDGACRQRQRAIEVAKACSWLDSTLCPSLCPPPIATEHHLSQMLLPNVFNRSTMLLIAFGFYPYNWLIPCATNLCKAGGTGSIPVRSTIFLVVIIELRAGKQIRRNHVEVKCARHCACPD